jgi:hypothetical protein
LQSSSKVIFLQTESVIIYQELHLPTIPKVIHRIAATMGCGMAARIPPNFPKIEKKSMKKAEIWITLRLPTRVSPTSPIFSGATVAPVKVPKNPFNRRPTPCHPIPRLMT